MDASGGMKGIRGEKGSILVVIAISLFVLLGMMALVMDMGYLYVTKGQLQTASDAAALAGIQKLRQQDTSPSLSQAAARLFAYSTAKQNRAAGKPVLLADSGMNGPMGVDNDISFGFWNFSGHSYSSPAPPGKPTNAIKVRARRTQNSPSGAVTSFFARALGWTSLEAESDAIAALSPRAGLYVVVSEDVCGSVCTFAPNDPARDPNGSSDLWPAACKVPKELTTKQRDPLDRQYAWTSLSEKASSASGIRDLLCTENAFVEVCGKQVWTTNGTDTDLLRGLESIMYDPNMDRNNKTRDNLDQVTAWWAIIPVTAKGVSPGQQGNGNDPKTVTGYAKVRIRSVRANGEASGCKGSSYSAPAAAPAAAIVIDRIMCVDCSNRDALVGTRGRLVE